MNISKNILSLGLIAVISGVSTAQTYTATAGTNGVTDIQSDYSMSTGDGASVSVDVPLEFELPKKVAIAIKSNGQFTTNPLFGDIAADITDSRVSGLLSLNSLSAAGGTWDNLSRESNYIGGAIYANSAVTFTVDHDGEYLHETDPNSKIKARDYVILRHAITNTNITYPGDHYNDSTITTTFPHNISIDDTTLMTHENVIELGFSSYAFLDTIDPTDRAGKYIQNVTFTVTTL